MEAVQEAFQFYATTNKGCIPKDSLPNAIRALGVPITNKQAQELQEQKEDADLEKFKDLLIDILEKRDLEKEQQDIKQAFDSLKDAKGVVQKRHFRNLLKNTGDKLTDEELQILDNYPDELDYHQFMEIITPPQPIDWYGDQDS